MTDEVEVLVELLTDVLGEPKQHYESKGQISFDCPVCAEEKGLESGDGKGNLEINYIRHVYKCWACGETHGTHGPLGKLFDGYATKQQKKVYNLIKPEELQLQDKKKVRLRLPEGLNYFVGRAWVNKKMKYKNPASVPKDEIIFNEKLIDWDEDIFLVEGAFDSFFISNPLVMLGKKMSKLIFETLYSKANADIVICVDGDAWEDGLKMYHELNGGRLYNKIKIVKLPKDKDVCDLRGNIEEYYYEIK